MPGKWLLPEQFKLSLEYAPRVTIELVVVNEDGEVLLKIREQKAHFFGHWHIPGGFLLKDELIEECVIRLLHQELSVSGESSIIPWKPLGVAQTLSEEDPERNAHYVHHLVRIPFESLTVAQRQGVLTAGVFHASIPANTIPYHERILGEFVLNQQKDLS